MWRGRNWPCEEEDITREEGPNSMGAQPMNMVRTWKPIFILALKAAVFGYVVLPASLELRGDAEATAQEAAAPAGPTASPGPAAEPSSQTPQGSSSQPNAPAPSQPSRGSEGQTSTSAESTPAPPRKPVFGLDEFAQPELAERLRLTARQQVEIRRILAEYQSKVSEADENTRSQIAREYISRLLEVLTPEQRHAYETGKALPRLRFQFRFQRWEHVLQWLAEQAGLSLVMDAPPPGTFNYTDTREYTPAEAIDLVNSVLLTKGYALIRREGMLILASLRGGIPEGIVPWVTPEEAQRLGAYDLVKVSFHVGRRDPSQVAEAIKPLLGAYGRVVPIPGTRQVVVTERAGLIATIDKVIQSLPEPSPPRQEPPPREPERQELRIYPLGTVDANAVMNILRELFPSARIVYDSKLHQLNIYTTSSQHGGIESILKRLQSPEAPERMPRLEVYTLPEAANVTELVNSLQLVAPNAKIRAEAETNRLIVWATPGEHGQIRDTLEKLKEVPDILSVPQLEAYRLSRTDARMVAYLLERLVPKARVSYDYSGRRLLVYATPGDQAVVRGVIQELEPQAVRGGPAELRVYTLRYVSPSSLVEMLREALPGAQLSPDDANRRLTVVAPPEIQAQVEKALQEADVPPEGEAQTKLQVYSLPEGAWDSTALQSITSSIQQSVPQAKVTPDPKRGQILVYATAGEHARIAEILSELVKGVRPVEGVLEIYTVTPEERSRLQAILGNLTSELPTLRIVQDTGPGTLTIWARPFEHEVIRQILSQLRQASAEVGAQELRSYGLRMVDPNVAQQTLKTVFPHLQIVVEAAARRLLLWASQEEHEAVARVLEEIDSPGPQETQPRFETYAIRGVNASTVLATLQQLVPGARLVLDGTGRKIVAWGTPSEHATIREALAQLGQEDFVGGGRYLTVYPLAGLESTNVLNLLQSLVPDAQLTVDSQANSLLAVATKVDHEVIQGVLDRLSEARRSLGGKEVRYYAYQFPPSSGLLDLLKRLAPSAEVTVDKENRRLMVLATPTDHSIIEQTLQQYEAQTPSAEERRLVVYHLLPGERKRLEALLPTLQSQMPELQILPETTAGEVAIWARPEEHRLIQQIVEQIREPQKPERPYQLIVHSVSSADPKSVVSMLEKLFPDAQVVLDSKSRRIMIWAPAALEPQIRQTLRELDSGPPGAWQEQLRVYPVTKIDLQVALQVLREQVPEARMTPDPKTNSLLVWAGGEDHKQIAKLLEELEAGVDERQRARLEIYPPGKLDVNALSSLLRVLVPEARLATDPKTGGLAVLAKPEDHELIRQTLDRLNAEELVGGPEARAYTVTGGGTVWGVINVLATVFPNIRVTIGTAPNQLLVWARPEEHEQVAKVLEELQREEPPERAPRLETYVLEGTNASEASRILRLLVPDATFTTGPDPQQLLVWARPADHAKIREVLEQWQAAVRKPEAMPELGVYQLRYLTAYGALQALRTVVPEAQISVGANDKQLVVLARPGLHERVAAALEKLDVPPQTAGELRIYTLEGMSTMRAFYASRFLREAVPEATFALGADPTQLLVWATPEQHERVQALVNTLLERAPPEKAARAAVYRLKHVTASVATQLLRAAAPDATLTVDSADPFSITVWASPQEHEIIARVIEQIDLSQAGEGQFVARMYTIEGISVFSVIQLLSRMFPAAQFLPTADQQQLLAWARAEEHPKIEAALRELSSPGEDAPSLVTYSLQSLDAKTATNLLQAIAPGAKVTVSTDGRKLLIFGRPTEHARIREVLLSADSPTEEANLRMEVYPVRGIGNAYTVMLLLREVFPQAKFTVGANLQQLVVYASPSEHGQIAQAIERLAELTQGEQPEMVVYDVGATDVARLALMLETAFPGTRFVASGEPGKLIAWASRKDHELIAQALEKLRGETWGPENRVMSVYPLRRGDAQTLLQLLTPVIRDHAQFVVDASRNALVVWADRRYHDAIRQTVEGYLASVDRLGELAPRVYRFRYADPSAAATVIRALCPDAQVAYDWANQVLVVSASPEDHLRIETALTQLDRPDVGGTRPRLQIYPTRGLDSYQLYANLRQLFRYDPTVQISLDENTGAIVAIAPEAKQEQIAEVIQQMELVAQEGGGAFVQGYSLRNIDPQAALSLVRNLAQQRGFRAEATLELRTNQLLVVARAEHHRLIAEALEQIRGEDRQLEILQLEELDPYSAQTAIRQLFADEAYPPEVSVEYGSQQLIIQATPEQHQRIRELLGKLGETRLAIVAALGGGTPRVVPVEGNPLEMLREVDRIWSRLRSNPIRVILPAGTEGGEAKGEAGEKLPGGGACNEKHPPVWVAFGGFQRPQRATHEGQGWIDSGQVERGGLSLISLPVENVSRFNRVKQGDFSYPPSYREGRDAVGSSRRSVSDFFLLTSKNRANSQENLFRLVALVAQDSQADQGVSGQGMEVPEQPGPSEKPASTAVPVASDAGNQSTSASEGTTKQAEGAPQQPSGPEGVPVYVIVQEGAVTIVSEDAEAAAELESLLRTLSAKSTPLGRSITVYELRHADAPTVADTIQEFLRSSGWGWRRTLGGLVIIPDERKNTILVQGSRADRAMIEELIRLLDTPQVPEAVRTNQPRIIPLRNMDATRAEEVVRNVFRAVFTPPQPRYTPWGTARQPTLGVLAPQLAVDTTTNSLIVSGPTAVVDQIAEFVERLDRTAAEDPARQLMIIPLQKLNAPRVERVIQELIPRSYWRRY
jgi:type II secretory pathway component GspD/PulD (secretin)